MSNLRSSSRSSENSESTGDGGLKIRSISYDSLTKLTGCLGNMKDDVAKLLLTSEKDLRRNPNLFTLVNEFFNTNTKLSELCESLQNCLEKAHRGETLVQEALSNFVEEKGVSRGEKGPSFRKTLRDLRSLTHYSCDDPFAGDFTRIFRSCHGDLVKMIGKLNATTKKLNRKLRRICMRRRVSMTVLLGAIVAFVATPVVVGVIAAPPVFAAAGAVASFVPVGSLGLFMSSLWQRSRGVLKRQRDAIASMERGTCVALSEVAKISVLVNQLEELMRSMGETAENAAEKRSLLESSMGKVEKDLLVYQNATSLLRHEAVRCDEDSRLSRDVARDNISKYLTREDNNKAMNRLMVIFSKK